MKAVAVICEYNPFHNGHICLLNEIKKAFPEHTVISVMSGNTVQRGELAIQPKYTRAESALMYGSDIVLELPFPFSVSAAEQFARAGVYICRSVGAEVLAFGSECGKLEALKGAAENLSSPCFEEALKNEISRFPGEPFNALRERVYGELYGGRLFDGGNDILALEYLKSAEEYGDITPYAVHRTAPFSATAARRAVFENDEEKLQALVPQRSARGEIHGGLAALSSLVIGYLRLTEPMDSGNGLRNAVKRAAEVASTFEELMKTLPTKTYTLARLRREIIAMLFGIGDEEKNALPGYTVLLGATEGGLEYLSERKKDISIPVLTKKADSRVLNENGSRQLKKAEICDSIYSLGLKNESGAYFKTPVIIKG